MPQRTTARKTATRTTRRQTASRRPSSKDIISMLKDDHRAVEGLFKKYKQFGPRAEKGRKDVVERLYRELDMHTTIEEKIVYPAMRQALGDGDTLMDEAEHEHDEVDQLLKELRRSNPLSDGYDEKVEQLRQDVNHHVKEEENEIFPKFRNAVDRALLMEMAEKARTLKNRGRRTR